MMHILKRLESCVDSFRITCKNIIEVNMETLGIIEEFEKNGNGHATQNIKEFVQINEDDFDDDFELGGSTTVGKIKIDLNDMDLRTWKQDLIHDTECLEVLYDIMC